MTAVLLRRLLRLLVVCVGISLITFLLLHLSGDPVAMILPEATEADRVTLRETLGLNKPWLVQYGSFIGRAVQGDFGQSFFHRAPAVPLPCPSSWRPTATSFSLGRPSIPVSSRTSRGSQADKTSMPEARGWE